MNDKETVNWCLILKIIQEIKKQGIIQHLGKGPWPKLGKNDKLNGKNHQHKTQLGAKFIVKIKLF